MQPPARFYWTKELDLRLVQAVQAHLGGQDVVKHQRKDGTNLKWDAVLGRLKASQEGWPAPVDSIDEVRKRWDNNLRVWYAKSFPEESDDGHKLRASVVSLPRLLELLTNRDYLEESKPGPKRGTKLARRVSKSAPDDSVDIDGPEVVADGSISHETPPPKRVRNEEHNLPPPAPILLPSLQRRLEPWLAFLRSSQFHSPFRIRTHSNILLEPKVLLDALVGDDLQEPFSHLLTLARAIASPEWSARVCDVSDSKAIQELLSLKRSFFMFPSKELFVDHQRLLFAMVIFPAPANQASYFYSFVQSAEASRSQGNENTTKWQSLGIPESIFSDGFLARYEPISPPPASLCLFVLHLFLTCLTNLQAGRSLQNLTNIWPGTELVRGKLLSALFLTEGVSIRPAPPFVPPVVPLDLPHSSIIEAITSLGFQVPGWFLKISIDKQQTLLEALRDLLKVVIFVSSLPEEGRDCNWNPKPDDKEVLLLAEKEGKYGVILRIHSFTATQATVSLLGGHACFQSLVVNGVDRLPSRPGEDIAVELSPRFEIQLGVEDIQIKLTRGTAST